MITSTNMSNPISAIKPNFGILTLKHDTGTLSKILNGLVGSSQDVVERTPLQGDLGKELSAQSLAKEFG